VFDIDKMLAFFVEKRVMRYEEFSGSKGIQDGTDEVEECD
jgi:hypothetical protein